MYQESSIGSVIITDASHSLKMKSSKKMVNVLAVLTYPEATTVALIVT